MWARQGRAWGRHTSGSASMCGTKCAAAIGATGRYHLAAHTQGPKATGRCQSNVHTTAMLRRTQQPCCAVESESRAEFEDRAQGKPQREVGSRRGKWEGAEGSGSRLRLGVRLVCCAGGGADCLRLNRLMRSRMCPLSGKATSDRCPRARGPNSCLCDTVSHESELHRTRTLQ